ncbi:MAG: hypothetical protein L0Y55_17060 [Anaerolineales bacterium]|nr:hypothetical protein [Anaerolineales bacterium]
MDQNGLREFLRGRKTPVDKIESFVAIAEKFVQGGGARSAAKDDVLAFSARMIRDAENTYDNYIALARYGLFQKNRAIYIAVVELLDGTEAMDNLHARLAQVVGAQKRDEVFAGLTLPVLGTPNAARPAFTQAVMARLESLIAPEVYRPLLANCLRTLGERDPAEREKFLACKNPDAFLQKKGDEFIAYLEQLKRENRLYFTQEITDDVIAYVEKHPEIRQGVRVGNVIYEAKIPYDTVAFLAATDAQMKRYHYCHCPWVKESLRANNVRVSPTFCLCSAGFHKKYWESVFGKPVQAYVVETVLQGNPWCKFAIHLPENF